MSFAYPVVKEYSVSEINCDKSLIYLRLSSVRHKYLFLQMVQKGIHFSTFLHAMPHPRRSYSSRYDFAAREQTAHKKMRNKFHPFRPDICGRSGLIQFLFSDLRGRETEWSVSKVDSIYSASIALSEVVPSTTLIGAIRKDHV